MLPEIARKLHSRELILFAGSGMSAPCYPTWKTLLEQLIEEKLSRDANAKSEALAMLEARQYLNAAWVIQHKIGNQLHRHLADKFARKPHPEVEARYALLRGLPFKEIFTTNYDEFLNEGRTFFTQQEITQYAIDRGHVLKLHGDISRPGTLVLSSLDYAGTKFHQLTSVMEAAAQSAYFLFLGYSLEDEDVLLWLERVCHTMDHSAGRHWALVDGSQWGENKRELYRHRYGIHIVDAPMKDGYPDIGAFLAALRLEWARRDAEGVGARFNQPPAWPERDQYVDPLVRRGKEEPVSLDEFISGWLADESRRFLVLLGEYGSGKTWFSRRAADLALATTTRKPVLVPLGEFRNGAGAEEVARKMAHPYGERFLEANRQGDLVLILDAFDEMGKPAGMTLNDSFERLRKLVDGKAKVILTSRKEFFRDDPEERLFTSSDRVLARGLETVEVQLLDPGRVEEALGRRGKGHIFAQIESNQRLLDLARRPVLLNLIADYHKPFDDNTRLPDLYEQYIQNLLNRGRKKGYAARREFAEKVAWEIQQSGASHLSVERVEKLAQGLVSHPDELREFWSRSLLVRHVDDFAFGHASFREYLVARQVWPSLQAGRYVPCKLSNPTIAFIREMWTWTPPPPREMTDKDGAVMVWVPPGPFIYGSGDTARVENLEQGFWIDKYPVTNAQYARFRGKKKVDAKLKDHPVVNVNHSEAIAYAKTRGCSLPTDLQWEKAAAGMDGRKYPWGDEWDTARCNTIESGRGGTSSVHEHEEPGPKCGVSPYGCVDMAGNVWEWTLEGERVRGGSWNYVRGLAARSFPVDISPPDVRRDNLGFRCSRT